MLWNKAFLFIAAVAVIAGVAAAEDTSSGSVVTVEDADAALNHVLYGQALVGKQDYDGAIAEFDKAIACDRKCAEAYFNRGKTYEEKGDKERALKDYTKAIECDPKHTLARYFRGFMFQRDGDLDAALAEYSRIVADDPNVADAHNNMGLIYDERGDFDRALKSFDRAISIDEDLYNVHLNRGIAYMKKGMYNLALQDFTKEVEVNGISFAGRHFKYLLEAFRKNDYAECRRQIKYLRDAKYAVPETFIKDLERLSRS